MLESGSPGLYSQDRRASLGRARGQLHVDLEHRLERNHQPTHVVGITRDLELGDWAGSWVGALFDYHPPKLALNRSEQLLLSCAFPGATDEQLAEDTGNVAPFCKETVGLHLPSGRRPTAGVDRRYTLYRMFREWPRKRKAPPPAGLSSRTSRGIAPSLALFARTRHEDEVADP